MGGEAENGKGPVDLFPAERVRMIHAHPGQETGWGGDIKGLHLFTPTLPSPVKGEGT